MNWHASAVRRARAQEEPEPPDPEHVLRAVERLAEVGYWEWWVGPDRVWWSPHLYRLYGVEPGKAPRTFAEFRSFVHPDDRDDVEAVVDRALSGPGPFSFEHRVIRGDGSEGVLRCRGEVDVGEDGCAVRLHGVSTDITELRAAEAAAEDSQERARVLTENLRTIVWLSDVTHRRLLYVNPAFEQIFGIPREVLEKDTRVWLAHVHPADRAAVRRGMAHAADEDGSGFQIEHRVLRPDGETRWLHVQTYPVRDGGGRVVRLVGTAEDVTERHEAEEALRDSELRLRQVAESSDAMFWLLDLDSGRYLYVNPAYERIFGRPIDELFDRPTSWLDAVHPDDRARAGVTPPGVFDEEYRVLAPDGSVRWVRARSFPVRDASGRPYRRVGVAEDVTERRQLREQLLQSQKLEAVGRLAGGVAHDFNNLLFVILNCVEEVLAGLPEQAPARDDLQHVLDAAERARALTEQLLEFSRQQTVKPEVVDVNAAVREALGMARRLLGEEVDIRLDLDETLPTVLLDPIRFQQVLLNLATNARDAMPDGGQVEIATVPSAALDGSGDGAPSAAASHPVALRVSDSGHGMTPEVAGRAFEPFFTTKPVGQGNGLGLSSVHGIIEAAGGHVLIDTGPGEGTTVTVLLPAADGTSLPDEQRTSMASGGGRTALVVEDEPLVREALVRGLCRAGFTVHGARSGEDALNLCRARLAQLDLLVTDLVMPGMSGRQLTDQLAKLGLCPPVVYVSGYAAGLPEHERHGPLRRFVQKPFRIDELLTAIEQMDRAAVAPNGAPDHARSEDRVT